MEPDVFDWSDAEIDAAIEMQDAAAVQELPRYRAAPKVRLASGSYLMHNTSKSCKCSGCGKKIRVGSQIYWNPNTHGDVRSRGRPVRCRLCGDFPAVETTQHVITAAQVAQARTLARAWANAEVN
jgi:hypothetical protein